MYAIMQGMRRIIAASRNKHKIREIDQITRKFGMDIVSRDEAGVPDIEIEETGTTFEENSFIKADEIMKLTGEITVADDSGLEVDCIGGAPGVYSARFGDGTDEGNNRKLVQMIRNYPYDERTGRFVSVITMVYPDGNVISARGEVEGHIILEPRGDNGFGYDPLFIPAGYDKTFGELPSDIKNKISHRAKALRILNDKLAERESGENQK